MADTVILSRYLERIAAAARHAVRLVRTRHARPRPAAMARSGPGRLIAVLAMFLGAPATALAASSPWLEVQGGRVRLVVLAPAEDGRIPAVLDFRLQPGWHTYWREPGAGGIPPSLTVQDPAIRVEAIDFPVPERFMEGDLAMAGYAEAVRLPLRLIVAPGARPQRLDTQLFAGICKDICIPVSGTLSVELPEAGRFEPLDAALVENAVAEMPPSVSASLSVSQGTLSPARDSVSFTVSTDQPTAAAPEVFLAGPPGVGFGIPVVRAQGDRAHVVTVPLRLQKSAETRLSDGATVAIRLGAHSLETLISLR